MNIYFFRMKAKTGFLIFAILMVVLAAGAGIGLRLAAAKSGAPAQGLVTPLHPTFALLDDAGHNVLVSGQPVSTMKTCGQCHDTEFIIKHSFHVDLGLSDIIAGRKIISQPWDSSTGIFGQWDPLTYRYLSQLGDGRFDQGTPEWVILNAYRIVGGGPATTSRAGISLGQLDPQAGNPETSILDTRTGQASSWNWNQSGLIEMDCFLCHFPNPDNQARVAAIQTGEFKWANMATLRGTGLVEKTADGWTWNAAAFDEDGKLLPEYVTVQDPTNANCALCHGLVHTDSQAPLTLPSCNDLSYPQTATTGQVIASQKISESGVNLANKDALSRSWDVHAERQLQCVDCHYAPNNPIYYQESITTRPDHLLFDPRRLDFAEYLTSPDHNLARGQSAQYNVAPELKGSMRRCESCHDAQKTHASWLPYTQRHLDVLACESCHIPQMYAPAIESYDWTAVNQNGLPATSCRGVQGTGGTVPDLVSGYQPVLLPRTDVDGKTILAPYNLITAWYWVYDDPGGKTLPVRLLDLESAWLTRGSYAPEVLSAFDANGDGNLDSSELVIDTPAKEAVIARRLTDLGLSNPRIDGQIRPYSINHDVVAGEYATRDCQTCHTLNSRLTQSIALAAYTPGSVKPSFVSHTNVSPDGQITIGADGSLYYQPQTSAEGRYIFGHDRVAWVDWFGGIFFLGVLAAIAGHSGLRGYASLRRPRIGSELKKIYMYQAYERFWHWLQTGVIVLLLFTGLIIHRPDIFGLFSFQGVVIMHNVLWAILAINAALSLFYHLASGQIRQFLPRPYGFFDDAIGQAKYYLRGIFKHEPHPFQKTPDRKMNPLQQITYLGILNVLLPLQGITGILMWGVQKWPQYARLLGGLPGLAPFHTLIAWTFAGFIVGHVYLTTTGGPKALDSIKAMVTGWEEVEAPTTLETMPARRMKKA